MKKFGHLLTAIFLICFFTSLSSNTAKADVPAFPGAEGGGANSVGGRGGRIIEVTNLNDSGPGSFRAACEAKGPRIVVFRVAGTINITSAGKRIRILHPYITIAGQTAPGGGICIKGGEIIIRTHDVIIRYLRIRGGKQSGYGDNGGRDNIWIGDGSYNVIIDHCSLTWATDENLSVWSGEHPAHNITISRNIIAEGLKPHSCGILTGSNTNSKDQTKISIHHNLFMSNLNRNPLIKSGSAEVVNNIIYNWDWFGLAIRGGVKIDIIGNKIKTGPSVAPGREIEILVLGRKGDLPNWGPPGTPLLYVKDNIGISSTSQNSLIWTNINGTVVHSLSIGSLTTKPNINGIKYAVTSDPVQELENIILDDVGADKRLDENGHWVKNRDSVDKRLINDYLSGSGKIPSNPAEVGGYPVIAYGSPPKDTDHDGMPDLWEKSHGLDPNNPYDGKLDADNDGYTNVEEYLNGSGIPFPQNYISPPSKLKIISINS